MLPSVELEGGGAPEAVLARVGLDELDVDALVPLVAAIAGYFAERGRLPDPPGLPTVRAFQRAQGEVTNAWLRRLWDARLTLTERPVPADAEQPVAVLVGRERVAGDRVVAAVLVGVAQEQREALAGVDRAPERVGVAPIGVALADRALPVPDVAGRHVQAPLLRDEVRRDRARSVTSTATRQVGVGLRPATTSARRSRRRRCGAARRSRGCRRAPRPSRTRRGARRSRRGT